MRSKKVKKRNKINTLATIPREKSAIAPADVGRRQLDPVRVYLKGFEGSPKTHSTMQESVVRLARAARRPIEAMPWDSMGFAETRALMAELQKTHGPRTVRVTMTALRG